MKFKRGYKHNVYTDELQSVLSHCIGKNTVEIYDDINNPNLIGVYHFGSLIAVFNDTTYTMTYNYRYYDYSNSTGRVRNAFSRYMMGFVPKLYDLRKLERTKDCIVYDTIFGEITVEVIDIEE